MADEGADFLEVDAADYLPSVKLSEDGARSLQQECVAGYAIGLLIRAKFFLKDLYLLGNERCVTYQPSANASKVKYLRTSLRVTMGRASLTDCLLIVYAAGNR